MAYSPNVNYRAVARNKARKYGLDPSIFQRQIGVESVGYSPSVISGRQHSPAGAIGIAQFMPGTAAGLGVDPTRPVKSLDAAARLMASYVRKYGSYRNALVAYNAGPGAVGGSLPGETQRYIANILRGANPTGLSRAQRGTRSVTVRSSTPATTSNGLSVPSPDLSALSSLLSQQPQVPAATPLAAPSFSSERYVPGGGSIASYGPQQPAQSSSLADALASIGQSADPSLSPVKNAGSSTSVTIKGAASSKAVGSAGFSVRKIDGVRVAVPKAQWNPRVKPMAPWLAQALAWAHQHGWEGTVTSGYRTAAEQAAAAGHYGLQHYPNGPQASNHRTGNAVDVDPAHARQLAQILRGYHGRKPVWGGPVMGDWVHFSNNGH